MSAKAEFRNDDGLLMTWRDLTTEPVWRYEESPPFLLSQLTEVDLLRASDSELARAIWFWCRRPTLAFRDNAAPMIVLLWIGISLFSALVSWRETPRSERVAEATILLCEVAVGIYLAIERIRFVRWRREYEVSIDRVIHSIHPGV